MGHEPVDDCNTCCGMPELGGPCPECPDPEVLTWWRNRESGKAITLPPQPIPPDLVKEMAMDIGKEIAAYIERQYPKAVEATSSTFLLSVRNSIYNQIIAAIGTSDPQEIRRRLDERKLHRRRLRALVKKNRDGTFYPGMPEAELEIALKSGTLGPEDELS